MFSKLSQAFLLFICASFVLTGCDQFLRGRSKDEAKQSNIVEIKADEINCLKNAPKDMQEFFDDEGKPDSIEKSLTCLQTSLKTFMRLTRGSQPDLYLAKDIQYHFNTFLLTENKISDQFQKEIMKFKEVVVGGSEDTVTRHELEQFIVFLEKLKPQLKKIQGKMRLAFFRGDRARVRVEELTALNSDLLSITDFIFKNTKLTDSKYEWLRFISFLKELNTFLGESKGLSKLLEWENLATSIKLLFLGADAKLINETNWREAGNWALNSYSTVLRFYYQILDRNLDTPSEWTTLVSWLDSVFVAIETAPLMREKKIFPVEAIDNVVDQVFLLNNQFNLFRTVLTPELTKSTYKKALVHFLDTQAGRGDELKVNGLSEVHLRILKQEYNIWKLSQIFLNETYSQHKRLELRNLRYYAPRFDITGKVKVSSLEKEEFLRSWDDFQKLLHTQPGVTYNKDLKIQIASLNEIQELPFTGANMINAVRTYTRLALRGYGDKNERSIFDRKMSRRGLIYLEEDFREFGRALTFLDEREKNPASRTFDQGNFFTFHGNGDDFLDATETYEILSVLISGGRTQINQIYADLENRRCLLPQKDPVFKRPYVDEACFYQAFKANYKTYLDHAPGMVKFLSTLNEKQFSDTYKALMSIAYLKEKTQHGRVEFSELRTLQCVLNYVETLMVVYDRNQDMLLTEGEVLLAAPRFKSFIAKASPLGNFLVEDIFLYLVFTGKKPTTVADGLDVAAFLAKRYSPLGIGTTGKYNLIQLLSVLNNESK